MTHESSRAQEAEHVVCVDEQGLSPIITAPETRSTKGDDLTLPLLILVIEL